MRCFAGRPETPALSSAVRSAPRSRAHFPRGNEDRDGSRVNGAGSATSEQDLQTTTAAFGFDFGSISVERPAARTIPAAKPETRGQVATEARRNNEGDVSPVSNELSPGQSLDNATRAFMESRFRHDFSNVRVHTDTSAAESARAINALAYAYGRDIYFGAGQFRPGTASGNRLIAHELSHVVQQRGRERTQRRGIPVGERQDASEARADAVADAVVGGLAVPDAGTAAMSVQRAVNSNGGSFDTTTYDAFDAPTGAVGEAVGCHIVLEFNANDTVASTKIGMIQSVKAMKSLATAPPLSAFLIGNAARGARSTVATGTGDPEEGQLIIGATGTDPGRKIDRTVHPDGRAQPDTSPIYAVPNSPGNVASKLSEGTLSTGMNQWGSHQKNPSNQFIPPMPARIDDSPHRIIEFAGQTYENTFETAAIAVEGPIRPNTYLGSVSWGYISDASGKVTLKPLTLVSAANPSASFLAAATLWNAATFHDTSTKAAAAPVGVPIPPPPKGKHHDSGR